MLELLSDKFSGLWSRLAKEKRLTESNIEQGIREIRLALLEAEVHVEAVKSLISQLREKAVGEKVIRDVDPTNMFIKMVNDALIDLLGGEEISGFRFPLDRCNRLLVCGLQGSGKTTSLAKLAASLKEKYDILTVSLDLHRPAAAEQLKILSDQAGVEYFDRGTEKNSSAIIKAAVAHAERKVKNLILIDTAGRTQVDTNMLGELKGIYDQIMPEETILVCDTMLGQESLRVAEEFKKTVSIDSLLFTKFDSDSRGGTILSVKTVLDIPIRYVGVGEGITDLEAFDPKRVVNRILGMGDIVGLVQKAEKAMQESGLGKNDPDDLLRKIKNNQFDLHDFLGQLQGMKKMGSLQSLVSMLPGMSSQIKNVDLQDKQFTSMEAVINSMTVRERKKPVILDNSRKQRIARGSGTTVAEVNRVLKKFYDAKDMMKKMSNPKKSKKMLNKMGINSDFLGKNI